jgi:adenosylhomocysteinase
MTSVLSNAPGCASSEASARRNDLPVLRETLAAEGAAPCRLVLVAHALDTAVPYVRALADAVDLVQLVPVPYSARATALSELDDLPVAVPESIEAVGRLAAATAVEVARTPGDPVVIQEVGGYCADQVADLAAAPLVKGIVEDTKQGQWRYEQLSELPLPVFTIADSPLKALEDVQVGRAIASSVEHLMRTNFYRILSEQRVLVLGYGGIGTALAEALRRMGARVAVHDPDEVRMSAAVIHGHRVGARAEVLRWADVVIGVSGKRSLSVEDAVLLRDGVVLASGSSKQVEFDVQGLRCAATSTSHGTLVESHEVAGRAVHLLNEGKPVNFLDQSILGGVLDLVYSELYLCTRTLARGTHGPGIHRLDGSLQQALARRWREHYGQD